jgi:hypothetical protein
MEEPLNEGTITTNDDSRLIIESDNTVFCTAVDLIAGQNYIAGNVSVSIDGDDLIITYSSTGGWELNVTHLYVGACSEIPQTGSGNPKIGHFPLSASHPPGTTEVIYTLDINTLPNCLCIAAHAEVSLDNGGSTQEETAWAEGPSFPGNSWAMYFSYCLNQCSQY